ncbi:MAG: hypothetical protein HZC19_03370 [Candidatus Omnitrophica bacterium]|nr:hypothetical protein [Candidatus Omnitrophota bacterium]
MIRKRNIFFLVIISILFSFQIISAQENIIPGEVDTQPSGTATDHFISAQAAKESLIAINQSIEQASQLNFVSANGTALFLNGQEYKFSFANQYYLFYKSQTMVDEIFSDAQGLGLNVLRTWGFCDGMFKDGVSFQPNPGVYDESGFSKMEYIIYKASQSNMKLIIPFVNNWDDFGGINQYVKWLTGTTPSISEHGLFFTDSTIKGWYKNYVDFF